LGDDSSALAPTRDNETLEKRSSVGYISAANIEKVNVDVSVSVNSDAGLVLHEGLLRSREQRPTDLVGQDTSTSFQIYPPSNDGSICSCTGNHFAWGECNMQNFHKTTDAGAESLAPFLY
ncbi:hypothetical protein PMIN06_011323, partial [Paraphaeosphaeria minitans]